MSRSWPPDTYATARSPPHASSYPHCGVIGWQSFDRVASIGLILSGIGVQPGSAGSIRWIIQFLPPVRNSTYRPVTRLPWSPTMTSSSRHFSVVYVPRSKIVIRPAPYSPSGIAP